MELWPCLEPSPIPTGAENDWMPKGIERNSLLTRLHIGKIGPDLQAGGTQKGVRPRTPSQIQQKKGSKETWVISLPGRGNQEPAKDADRGRGD